MGSILKGKNLLPVAANSYLSVWTPFQNEVKSFDCMSFQINANSGGTGPNGRRHRPDSAWGVCISHCNVCWLSSCSLFSYYQGSSKEIPEALTLARAEFLPKGPRNNTKVVWLVTDGFTDNITSARLPVDQLKNMGKYIKVSVYLRVLERLDWFFAIFTRETTLWLFVYLPAHQPHFEKGVYSTFQFPVKYIMFMQ